MVSRDGCGKGEWHFPGQVAKVMESQKTQQAWFSAKIQGKRSQGRNWTQGQVSEQCLGHRKRSSDWTLSTRSPSYGLTQEPTSRINTREGQSCTKLRKLTSETWKVPSSGTCLGAEPADAINVRILIFQVLIGHNPPRVQSQQRLLPLKNTCFYHICCLAVYMTSFPPQCPSPEIKECNLFTFITPLQERGCWDFLNWIKKFLHLLLTS